MVGHGLFNVYMFAGAGSVGAWLFVRLTKSRPRTLNMALAHFVMSWATFQIVPPTTRLLLHLMPGRTTTIVSIAAVILPALVYVCLSWLWLLAYIRDALPGRPSGGHPVTIPD